MTSIASSAFAQYSPLSRLQAQLSSDITAGSIKASDQTALSAALQSIDASLQADRASQSASSSAPDKSGFQSKIDSLIQSQVDSGALTSDQATELKKVFSETFSKHGAGHHHRGGGSQSASNDSSSGGLLQQFLDQLKSSTSTSTSYGANGASSTPDPLSLLINAVA
ncbi:hypothetical protein [Terrarubrum flagellatum]|uniref:hypothetical protein n=1 Tax=Terrirubrum flagellatum TaxID=2895980 RepID=UPI003144E33B